MDLALGLSSLMRICRQSLKGLEVLELKSLILIDLRRMLPELIKLVWEGEWDLV